MTKKSSLDLNITSLHFFVSYCYQVCPWQGISKFTSPVDWQQIYLQGLQNKLVADKVHRIENESWNLLNQPTDAQNQIIKVSVERHHKDMKKVMEPITLPVLIWYFKVTLTQSVEEKQEHKEDLVGIFYIFHFSVPALTHMWSWRKAFPYNPPLSILRGHNADQAQLQDGLFK